MNLGIKNIVVQDKGANNQVDIAPSVKANGTLNIRICGRNNHLIIDQDTVFAGGLIEMRNHDSSIQIGSNCFLAGHFRCRARNTHIRIGDRSTAMRAQLSLHEAGCITLGVDCMLSGDVTMDVSDMHSIFDRATKTRVNPASDIIVGDHVWLAQGVRILKGGQIGQNTVIGARSTVVGKVPAHSLAVGTPARVIRTDIDWDRHLS